MRRGTAVRWVLAILGAAAIAAASAFVTVIWIGLNTPSRPDSSLTDDLPLGWDIASREFNRRITARFPPGSSAVEMARELAEQGFAPVSWWMDGPVHAAVRDESHFPCRIAAEVNWRADATGRIASISGRYGEHGCL
jgi:hypothetical protein